jgi:Spy/CpxP family protein refolding chaperone
VRGLNACDRRALLDELTEVIMKPIGNRKTLLLILITLSVIFVAFSSARAGCAGNASQQQQSDAQQNGPDQDPVTPLNLTPEQREQIRAIREQSKDERFARNQRLRQAQLALEESLDSDNPGEALIEQRLRDVADAQAALMRMRVLTELRIRHVLTPQQLNTLRQLRRQAKDVTRERRLQNFDGKRRRMGPGGSPNAPNQRNGLGPLFPRNRRGDIPRKPRP